MYNESSSITEIAAAVNLVFLPGHLTCHIPISFCENVSKMRVEAFHQPYPWCSKGSPLPLANSNGLQMKVNNCVESDDFFILQIVVECNGKNISGYYSISLCLVYAMFNHFTFFSFSGLNVATNQRLPCECSEAGAMPLKVKAVSLL